MTVRIRELEDQNFKMEEALKKNAEDFKDLLKEINKQKTIIKDREQ